MGRRGDTPSTGMITCPLLRVVVVGMPVHLANSSGRGWSHTSWLFAISLQKTASTLYRWWWWMHPLRSPHYSGWSLTSCLLTIRLENYFLPSPAGGGGGCTHSEVCIGQPGQSEAVHCQSALGTLPALTCRWWWWVHTLRSLHWPAWSITSCLLTICLENSSCPHLQVVVVGAHIQNSALASLVN